MENVPLIDVSIEDDLLIPFPSLGLGTNVNLEAEKIETASKILEQVPNLSDSLEQKQKIFDRYHLRRSLAWDSAFFTSEGILNSEELAIINGSRSGFTLPGIEEELRVSSESTSTLERDSRALEQLEVNLFENVQVPIQKSLGNSNNSRKMVHSEKIKGLKKLDGRSSRYVEKIDVSSHLKLPTASRKHVVTRQQQEHTSKDHLIGLSPSLKNGGSNPLIKLTKVSCKIILPSSVPVKKTSTDMTKIKTNTGKAFLGVAAKQHSIVVFNKSNEAQVITPRTTPSSNSKILKNNRIGYTKGIHHPNLVKSSLTLSKVSPASSIDTVTSESLSMISTSTKLEKSLKGSADVFLSPPLAFSSSHGISKYSGLHSQSNISDQTKNNVNGDSAARVAKPSGLQIPSPTLGYFDREKSRAHGSNKVPKPSWQNNVSKSAGVKHIVAMNKMRPIYLSAVRDRGLKSAPTKHVLKSAEVQVMPTTRNENLQEPCPKNVHKISSHTASDSRKTDLKGKLVHIG